ncbi:hypothetical protein IQ231_21735 [Cuspidothrix issatschenkoi LEGE 03284]|uniref:hypothetical protein n=1 Tax=Cuspidothrix issatschenkoi TaxID=230752 RepID=UPI00187DF65C|nr:hypothetical protein [Cuspidothrix issatschenkoi]MBE9234195.1 hypothetical protein [Cuspidothrix issatschenkoi LEGE 03284]
MPQININWTKQHQQVAREDLVMFINACLSCTGQREFYSDGYGQRVSIDFLHDYILGNYRLLYTRTLAAGINHFNQAQIILKLLATGKHTSPEHRQEEGTLIAAALASLPPQRGWDVLQQLRKRGINNRRSRAIARDYLQQRRNINFDAVKYRSKFRAIASHAHLTLPGELGNFLFGKWKQRVYQTELFETFRQAHYSAEAVYQLPFTVAEGLAAKHGIKREVFLSGIQDQMTLNEKLRLQTSANRTEVEININLGRLPLTRLVLYILSLPLKTRKQQWHIFNQALEKSAALTLKKSPLKLRRVAAVLDCSYSSSGSTEKHLRPLGVALAAHYLLKAASQEYQAFWTIPTHDPLLILPRGQTDLATPLLDALDWGADLVVIITDGWENDPPNGASEILRIYGQRLDPQQKTSIVHCNPVYNADDFSLHPLSPEIPTVGLRDAEDLPTMLGFARFAQGSASLAELEEYLAERVKQMLNSTAIKTPQIQN